jgi:hypothetical protein
MADAMLIEEKALICGMCGRRICDISIIGDNVTLLRVSYHLGIPQQASKDRGPRGISLDKWSKTTGPECQALS